MMDLISEIQQVRDSFYTSKDRLMAAHSSWDKDRDARVTLFHKCANVLNDVQLGLVFIQFHLTQQQWWKSIAKKNIPDHDKQIYINEFGMFVKMGFLQFVFSSIESSLRLFVKAVDPSACAGGTAEFKNIYAFLFARFGLQKWEPLLDLLRCVRNTIHNNGVYFHRSGKDETVTYKGVNYSFVIGAPVDFVDWAFLIGMMNDIDCMVQEVVSNSELVAVPAIIDPFFVR